MDTKIAARSHTSHTAQAVIVRTIKQFCTYKYVHYDCHFTGQVTSHHFCCSGHRYSYMHNSSKTVLLERIACALQALFMELQDVSVVSGLHEQTSTIDVERGYNGNKHSSPTDVPNNLLYYCAANKNLLLFLRMTGTYFAQSENLLSFDRLWFSLSLCVNIGSLVINFIYMWLVIFLFSYPSSALQFSSAGIDFAIVIRTLSVLPAQTSTIY